MERKRRKDRRKRMRGKIPPFKRLPRSFIRYCLEFQGLWPMEANSIMPSFWHCLQISYLENPDRVFSSFMRATLCTWQPLYRWVWIWMILGRQASPSFIEVFCTFEHSSDSLLGNLMKQSPRSACGWSQIYVWVEKKLWIKSNCSELRQMSWSPAGK